MDGTPVGRKKGKSDMWHVEALNRLLGPTVLTIILQHFRPYDAGFTKQSSRVSACDRRIHRCVRRFFSVASITSDSWSHHFCFVGLTTSVSPIISVLPVSPLLSFPSLLFYRSHHVCQSHHFCSAGLLTLSTGLPTSVCPITSVLPVCSLLSVPPLLSCRSHHFCQSHHFCSTGLLTSVNPIIATLPLKTVAVSRFKFSLCGARTCVVDHCKI